MCPVIRLGFNDPGLSPDVVSRTMRRKRAIHLQSSIVKDVRSRLSRLRLD